MRSAIFTSPSPAAADAGLSAAEWIALVQSKDATIEGLQQQVDALKHRVEWFERQVFGAKSERYAPQPDPAQLHLGEVFPVPQESREQRKESLGQHIKSQNRVQIYSGKNGSSVYALLRYRAPVSKNERAYTPLIVPPVHLKEFDKPIFTSLWQDTVSVLSTAKKVVFLGYSMPPNDLHVQFIMRCGFHNQTEGLPEKNGRRSNKTGPAKVVIVNPDQSAARRIAGVVGSASRCHRHARAQPTTRSTKQQGLRTDCPHPFLRPNGRIGATRTSSGRGTYAPTTIPAELLALEDE